MMHRERTTILAVAIAALVFAGCGKIYEAEELPRVFTLKRGTELIVSPVNDMVPQRMNEGDLFAGVLAEPLVYGDVLVAPRGAPVVGSAVAQHIEQEGETKTVHGVTLSALTLHGGEEFAVSTVPLFQETVLKDAGAAPVIKEDHKLVFVLDEPAAVSMVIDQREAVPNTPHADS